MTAYTPTFISRAKDIALKNPPVEYSNPKDLSATQGYLSCKQLEDLLISSSFQFSRPEVEFLASGIEEVVLIILYYSCCFDVSLFCCFDMTLGFENWKRRVLEKQVFNHEIN